MKEIYYQFKEMYTMGLDAALVVRDLEIEKGRDPLEANEKYTKNIEDINMRLRLLEGFMFYTIQKLNGDKILYSDTDTFFKTKDIQLTQLDRP
jgi:hypothetical protein